MTEAPAFPEVSSSWRADLKDAIEAMPASKLLGLRVVGFAAEGVSRVEMPIRHDLTFDGEVVQGGIVGVLADYAGVSAATCTLPPGWAASTTGFEVHNIAPARGELLVAVGRVVSVGRSIGVSRAEVHARRGEQWRLVCVATTTCRPYESPAAHAVAPQ